MPDSKHTKKPIILNYQKEVYERLCAYTRVGLHVPQKSIGALKIRKNFLLLGPTGSGKTFLANAVSQDMQVPFLTVSVSDWVILGASTRGSSYTWLNIAEFLKNSLKHDGAIIFIDELDKCYHESNWNACLRSEIFSLCDARIPLGLEGVDDESKPEDSDDDDVYDEDEDSEKTSCRDKLQNFIQNNLVIIGGAAFQDIWEKRSTPSMGFNSVPQSYTQPEIHELTQYLPPELVNRFASELFILPKLCKNDYREMIMNMSCGIAETWRKRFLEIGLAKLDLAVKYQKGARYAEEIILEAIVKERANIFDPSPIDSIDTKQVRISGNTVDEIGID